MKKSRHIYLHPKINPGKLQALEALHGEYVNYVRICVQTMLDGHKLNLRKSEKQSFFPKAEYLTSQIQKNARDHAIQLISTWAAVVYQRSLKDHIRKLHQYGEISQEVRHQLHSIGKYLLNEPKGIVTQETIDLYWEFLLDPKIVGKPPKVTNKISMRMSENTSELTDSEETLLAPLWIKISTLVFRKVTWLPLTRNPYLQSTDQVSKGISARKDPKGRWRFEVVEKKDWAIPEAEADAPRIGVDVGLNVIAATSDGRLFGADIKPKFNRLYHRVQNLRANRQRQGLRDNSPRLARLEQRLTGLVKTAVGEVSNKLVHSAPTNTIFVLEDLDLRGCRGQKRFAYRALAHSLETKAPTIKVNPAYSSQMCPSCGYVSRRNRAGTKFACRSCGRRSHADVVGGINLLGRSEDKQISLNDHPKVVRKLLRERYHHRRDSSVALKTEPEPSGRRFTTKGSLKDEIGTASNPIPRIT